jgi:mannose-1-phosphate guanylyltransferase
MTSLHVVILAGGLGSRFWPISRIKRPKQFLSINSTGESLIQATARRIAPLIESTNLWVVTNRLQEHLVREHVPSAHVLLEPEGRNTAASIGLAALHIHEQDPNAVLIVLPADHAVTDEEKLREALQQASRLAATKPYLVTVGIAPTFANTAYGYILRGKSLEAKAYAVSRFYEKPSYDRAKQYFESGKYFWNSGMFAWHSEVILSALEEFMPSLYEGLVRIQKAHPDKERARVTEEVFLGLDSLSIDFGVLEHARNCAVISSDPFGWNDVGSWDAWAENFERDGEGNLSRGDSLLIDSTNCVVYSEKRFTAVVGGEDLVIIDSGDALLVCPRDRVQDVKRIVDELKKQGRSELV